MRRCAASSSAARPKPSASTLSPISRPGSSTASPEARGAGTLFVQPKIQRLARQGAMGDAVLLDDLLQFRFLIAAATAEPQTWLTPESRELWRRLGGERIVIGPSDQTHPLDGDAGNDVQYLAETDALFTHGCRSTAVPPSWFAPIAMCSGWRTMRRS